MGIDIVTFRHLLRVADDLGPGKRALVLGRQHFLKRPLTARMERQLPVYQSLIDMSGREMKVEALIDDDGFSDSVFKSLGFAQTDYMDISDYEGANVLHDLNQPVPEHMWERYDFILDGGTIEHIFNVPEAFKNVDRMLRPDGRFLALNPANNWLGHGFYQFGPEIVWSFWRDMMGYEVITCGISAMRDFYGKHTVYPGPPEDRDGARDHAIRKMGGDAIRLLVYDVRKGQGAQSDAVQQSDYVKTWSEGGEPP